MSHLNIHKLHVDFTDNITRDFFDLPRTYTLTHSDRTGDLFLSIGRAYNLPQVSNLLTRFMRDEVLAMWQPVQDGFNLHLTCHVSGGFVLGPAGWRLDIFRTHLPLVLEALRYGDRGIYEHTPALDRCDVVVHFISHRRRYNLVENWGSMGNYALPDQHFP